MRDRGTYACGFAVVLLWAVNSATAFNLTILHTNDVHSRFEEANTYGGRCPPGDEGRCFGGVARQHTKVQEIRERIPNVLFLNAGDWYQGTMWYSVHKWRIVVDFMNRLKHDVMALGNHEFDDGISGVTPFLERAEFPVVVCNIDASLEPEVERHLRRHVVVSVGGEKIGVIGYITPETKVLSSTGKLKFTDEVDCLKKEVATLRDGGVNKIIAVGHSGFTRDKEIAAAVEGLDIVVGGHTDTFLYTGKPPSNEKPVDVYPVVVRHADGIPCLVVQDYTFGKYLGFLQVQFDVKGQVIAWSGNPILLDSSVAQDPEILAALKPYTDEVVEKGKETMGLTAVLLRGDRGVCRARECNMGNFLADACVHRFLRFPHPPDHWTVVSVAIWNSGGIRASIDERLNSGNITMEDVLAVAPFHNTIDIVELMGADLRTVFEHSVYNYDPTGEDMPGAFLQVSGARVAYDLSQPPGHRVAELELRCARCRVPRYLPVNDSEEYHVAVPSFLIKGGDGYGLIEQRARNILLTNILDLDIIAEYLDHISPVTTGVEGRITFLPPPSVLAVSSRARGATSPSPMSSPANTHLYLPFLSKILTFFL